MVVETRKSKIKSVNSTSDEGPLPGLQMAAVFSYLYMAETD